MFEGKLLSCVLVVDVDKGTVTETCVQSNVNLRPVDMHMKSYYPLFAAEKPLLGLQQRIQLCNKYAGNLCKQYKVPDIVSSDEC